MNEIYRVEGTFDEILMEYKWKEINGIINSVGEERPWRCLEIGTCDGLMTQKLSEKFIEVVSVEPDQIYYGQTSAIVADNKIKNVKLYFSTLEALELEIGHFDWIIASHVLEHVEDPIRFLEKARTYLRDKHSKLIITVPNAQSLHRLMGVEMGILDTVYSFSEADKRLNHKRIYDENILYEDIKSAGMVVEKIETYFIKPLSSKQMMAFSPEIIEGFYKLSKNDEMKYFGNTIFAVCSLPIVQTKTEKHKIPNNPI